MKHRFDSMGTVVSIDLPRLAVPPSVLGAVEEVFAGLDERFSLYRTESELSRVARDEVRLLDSSQQLRDVYAAALGWRESTLGSFTPHRPDGVIDLNGIVKAIAIRDAAAVLLDAGIPDWCINAGGDVLCAGHQPDDEVWAIGIVDPERRDSVLCSVALHGSRRAVATSGSTERGDHIWRDDTRQEMSLSQVTVVADDIVTADVLATAIVAGGQITLDHVTSNWDVDVLTIDDSGAMLATPGIRLSLAE